MSSMAERGAVEDYYPHYVDEDAVEFSHAYWKCRCGWRSDDVNHPSKTTYHQEQHLDWGQTPDCGVGKHAIVFEDGSVAEI